MKYKSFLLIIILLAIGLSACSSAQSTDTQPPTMTSSDIDSQMQSQLIITDALGQTQIFQETPSRIVITGKATTMIMDAFYLFPESVDRIAAIGLTGQGSDFFPIVDPNAVSKATLDGQAGPEQIAALHPDLVVLKSYLAEKLGSSIETLGIPVFYISLETPDQYFQELEMIGKLFGDEKRAAEIVSFYQKRMTRVEAALNDLTEEQKPRVLLLQHSAKGGETSYSVPSADWMQTLLVDMAGGRPVWNDIQLQKGWTVVTLEQIAAWNPDQIYIIDYFDDPVKAVDALRVDPIGQNLEPVKTGQIFAFPKDTYSWDQPDTRWILGLEWLAAHIHPDRFPNFDVEQEFFTFYRTLYGLDDTTIKKELIPLLVGTIQ